MIDLQSFILNYVNNFSYLGLFILMAVIALVPIPEEIVLLIVGYFAAYGFAELDKILTASILGVILGDNLVYFLSRKNRKYFHKIKNKLTQKKFLKYESLMKSHSGKTIFLLRFIIGLRFFGPFMAGHMKVKWKKFFFYNSLAVLIFVPIFILLGYHFIKIFDIIIKNINNIRHIIFLFILIIISVFIYHFVNKKFFNKKN